MQLYQSITLTEGHQLGNGLISFIYEGDEARGTKTEYETRGYERCVEVSITHICGALWIPANQI